MKIFIWDRLEKITSGWHKEGGCVVIAESLEKAYEQLRDGEGVPDNSDVFTTEPVKVLTVGDLNEPDVFIFPDAGCC